MSREPFVMVPISALVALDGDALRVWALLDHLARSGPAYTVAHTQLATALGLSVSSVQRRLRELVEGGWVERVRTGRASTYRPLHRARPAAVLPDLIGQNRPIGRAGDRSELTDRQPVALSIRTREEEEPRSLSRRRPPWCGRCAPDTRLTDADRPQRCPACHPLTQPLF